MYCDIETLSNFYETTMGDGLAGLTRLHLSEFIADKKFQTGLFLGYAKRLINSGKFFMPPIYGYPDLMGYEKMEIPTGNMSLLCNPYNLPFKPESMEFIFAQHYFDHTVDIIKSMDEVYRVLVSGGIMISLFNNTHGFWIRSDDSPFADAIPYSLNKFSTYLNHAGLTIVKSVNYGYAPLQYMGQDIGNFLEKIGAKYFPQCGGITMVMARKISVAPSHTRARNNYSKRIPNPYFQNA